jgi:DNA-binding MarR family transcriptional regulator
MPSMTNLRDPRGRDVETTDVLEFLQLLWAIDHELQRASKRMFHALGVTGPQRLAIRVISQTPDASAQQIARALHLHKSTVTVILERLENDGLIARTTDPADGRRIRLRLTARGRRVSAATGSTVEAAVHRALLRAPRTALAGARRVLALVAAELREHHDGPARQDGSTGRPRTSSPSVP